MNIGQLELRFLERLAQRDPASPGLLDLVRQCLDQDQPEAGGRIAEKVLSAHPDNLEAALLLAQALERRDRAAEARRVLKDTGPRLDALSALLRDLADILGRVGEARLAVRAARAGEALRPVIDPAAAAAAEEEQRRVATETLAQLYIEQGFNHLALEILEEILSRDPGNERVREKIAELRQEPTLPFFQPLPSARRQMADRLERLKEAARRRRLAVQSVGP